MLKYTMILGFIAGIVLGAVVESQACQVVCVRGECVVCCCVGDFCSCN